MMPKMGRGIKVFFCSFCLNRNSDGGAADQSFTQGIDVSHLATPHSSYSLPPPSATLRTPVDPNCNKELPFTPPVPQTNNSNSNNNNNNISNSDDADLVGNNYSTIQEPKEHHYNTPNIPNNCILPMNRCTPDALDSRPERSSPAVQSDRLQHPSSDNNQSLPSTHSSLTPISNIYEHSQDQQHQIPSQQINHDAQIPPHLQQQNHQVPQEDYNHARLGQNQDNGDINNQTSTKLSYDIISVREPLAKILAERQILHQAQLQQRQILGDHEYIEVYGERGSSCFYEEIAGSTTSSATYDQIGNVSNHNYQALINAYAVTNRNRTNDNQEQLDYGGEDVVDNSENIYNLAQSNSDDQSPKRQFNNDLIPSTSYNSSNNETSRNTTDEKNASSNNDRGLQQSIPVYSVINKASRRGDAIVRGGSDSFRPPPPPPPPPPKNPTISNNQTMSTGAIPHYQQSTIHMNNQFKSTNPPQIPSPSTSTALSSGNEDNSEHNRDVKESIINRLPQPPPRYNKHPSFDAAKRPLPLPDNYQVLHKNNNNINNNRIICDEDIESLNNGYELLTNPNFNEDVGYEKIRETNQYSGGSRSSHFNPLQHLDNEGYESVQPIYSSPSNALVEPNYEAIGPSTASELAAAATARLNAAAAVIDYLRQDQT